MQVTLIKHTSRGICCDKEKIQQHKEDGKRVVGGENDQNIDMYKNVKELKNKLKQNTESCSAQLHKQKAKHFCGVWLKACHRQKCAENQSKSLSSRGMIIS